MAHSVTEHDPWWTPDDAAEQFALQLEDDVACPGCGLPLDETTDEDYPWTYDVELTPPCIACEERHEAHGAHADRHGRLPVGRYLIVRESDEAARLPSADVAGNGQRHE